MKNITDCKAWMDSHKDIVVDLIRIYLGVALFAKGLYFMMHKEALSKLLEGADTMAFVQGAVAHYVIPAHLVGGLLLALGLLTRLAALSQIPILLGAVFYVYHWGVKGATPGKRLLGLVVVAEDGSVPIGLSRAAIRVLGYLLSGLTLGIGFLMIALSGSGLHDRLAGTRVVRRERG